MALVKDELGKEKDFGNHNISVPSVTPTPETKSYDIDYDAMDRADSYTPTADYNSTDKINPITNSYDPSNAPETLFPSDNGSNDSDNYSWETDTPSNTNPIDDSYDGDGSEVSNTETSAPETPIQEETEDNTVTQPEETKNTEAASHAGEKATESQTEKATESNGEKIMEGMDTWPDWLKNVVANMDGDTFSEEKKKEADQIAQANAAEQARYEKYFQNGGRSFPPESDPNYWIMPTGEDEVLEGDVRNYTNDPGGKTGIEKWQDAMTPQVNAVIDFIVNEGDKYNTPEKREEVIKWAANVLADANEFGSKWGTDEMKGAEEAGYTLEDIQKLAQGDPDKNWPSIQGLFNALVAYDNEMRQYDMIDTTPLTTQYQADIKTANDAVDKAQAAYDKAHLDADNYRNSGAEYDFGVLDAEKEAKADLDEAVAERKRIEEQYTNDLNTATNLNNDRKIKAAFLGNETVEDWQATVESLQSALGYFTPASTEADYGTAGGNIDLNARPVLTNVDGTYSTVDSVVIQDGDQYVLIPTVIEVDGEWKHVSQKEAEDHYKATGEQLGKFDSESSAEMYAFQIEQDQAHYYHDTAAEKLLDEAQVRYDTAATAYDTLEADADAKYTAYKELEEKIIAENEKFNSLQQWQITKQMVDDYNVLWEQYEASITASNEAQKALGEARTARNDASDQLQDATRRYGKAFGDESDPAFLQKALDYANTQLWDAELNKVKADLYAANPETAAQEYADYLQRQVADYNAMENGMGVVYGDGNINLHERFVGFGPDKEDDDIELEDAFDAYMVYDDGQYVNVPAMVKDENGEWQYLSRSEAAKHYRETGEYFGKYDTLTESRIARDKLQNEISDTLYESYWTRQYNELDEQIVALDSQIDDVLDPNDENVKLYNDLIAQQKAVLEEKKKYSSSQDDTKLTDEQTKRAKFFQNELQTQKARDYYNSAIGLISDNSGRGLENIIAQTKAELGYSMDDWNADYTDFSEQWKEEHGLGNAKGLNSRFQEQLDMDFFKAYPEYASGNRGLVGEREQAFANYLLDTAASGQYDARLNQSITEYANYLLGNGNKPNSSWWESGNESTLNTLWTNFDAAHPEYQKAIDQKNEELGYQKSFRGIQVQVGVDEQGHGVYGVDIQRDKNYQDKVKAGERFADLAMAIRGSKRIDQDTINPNAQQAYQQQLKGVTGLLDVIPGLTDTQKKEAEQYIARFGVGNVLPNDTWSYTELQTYAYYIGNGELQTALEYAKDQNRLHDGETHEARVKAVQDFSAAMAGNLFDGKRNWGDAAGAAYLLGSIFVTGIPTALGFGITDSIGFYNEAKRTGEVPIYANPTVMELMDAVNAGLYGELGEHWQKNINIPFFGETTLSAATLPKALQSAMQSTYVVGMAGALASVAGVAAPALATEAAAKAISWGYTTLAYGGASYANAFQESFARTGDVNKANQYALASAFADGFSEAVSLDIIFDKIPDIELSSNGLFNDIVNGVLKTSTSGFVEASEEFNTEKLTNAIAEWIEGERSEYHTRKNELLQESDITPEEAEYILKQEEKKKLADIVTDSFASGALMGFGNAVREGKTNQTYRQIGNDMLKSGLGIDFTNSVLDHSKDPVMMQYAAESPVTPVAAAVQRAAEAGYTPSETTGDTETTTVENAAPAAPETPAVIPPANATPAAPAAPVAQEGSTPEENQAPAIIPPANTTPTGPAPNRHGEERAEQQQPLAIPRAKADENGKFPSSPDDTEEESRVKAILNRKQDSVTIKEAREIARDQGLRDAFKAITGIELTGTIKNMADQIRSAKAGLAAEVKNGSSEAEGVSENAPEVTKEELTPEQQKYNENYDNLVKLNQEQTGLEDRLEKLQQNGRAATIFSTIARTGKKVPTIFGNGVAYEKQLANGKNIHIEFADGDKHHLFPRAFIYNGDGTITGFNAGAKGKTQTFKSQAEYVASYNYKQEDGIDQTIEKIGNANKDVADILNGWYDSAVEKLQNKLNDVRGKYNDAMQYLLAHTSDAPSVTSGATSETTGTTTEEATAPVEPASVDQTPASPITEQAPEVAEAEQQNEAPATPVIPTKEQFDDQQNSGKEDASAPGKDKKPIDLTGKTKAERIAGLEEAQNNVYNASDKFTRLNDAKDAFALFSMMDQAKDVDHWTNSNNFGYEWTLADGTVIHVDSPYDLRALAESGFSREEIDKQRKKYFNGGLDKATKAPTDVAVEAWINFSDGTTIDLGDAGNRKKGVSEKTDYATLWYGIDFVLHELNKHSETKSFVDEAMGNFETMRQQAETERNDARQYLKDYRAAMADSSNGKQYSVGKDTKQEQSTVDGTELSRNGEPSADTQKGEPLRVQNPQDTTTDTETATEGTTARTHTEGTPTPGPTEGNGETDYRGFDKGEQAREITSLAQDIRNRWNSRMQAVAENGTRIQAEIAEIYERMKNNQSRPNDASRLKYLEQQQANNTAKTGDIARDIGKLALMVREFDPGMFNAIVLENGEGMFKTMPNWFFNAVNEFDHEARQNTESMAYLYAKTQNPNSIVLSDIGTTLHDKYGLDAGTAADVQSFLEGILKGSARITYKSIQEFAAQDFMKDYNTRNAIYNYILNTVGQQSEDLLKVIQTGDINDVLNNTWKFFRLANANIEQREARSAGISQNNEREYRGQQQMNRSMGYTQGSYGPTPTPVHANDNLAQLMQARQQAQLGGTNNPNIEAFRMDVIPPANTSMPGAATENRAPRVQSSKTTTKTESKAAQPAPRLDPQTRIASYQASIPQSAKDVAGRQIKIGRRTYNVYSYYNMRHAQNSNVTLDVAAKEFKLILDGAGQNAAINWVAKTEGTDTGAAVVKKGDKADTTEKPKNPKEQKVKNLDEELEKKLGAREVHPRSWEDKVRLNPSFPWKTRREFVESEVSKGKSAEEAHLQFDMMMDRAANDTFGTMEVEYGITVTKPDRTASNKTAEKAKSTKSEPKKSTSKKSAPKTQTAPQPFRVPNVGATVESTQREIASLTSERDRIYNDPKGNAERLQEVERKLAAAQEDLATLQSRHGGTDNDIRPNDSTPAERSVNPDDSGAAGTVSAGQVGSAESEAQNSGGGEGISGAEESSDGRDLRGRRVNATLLDLSGEKKRDTIEYNHGFVVYDSFSDDESVLTNEERSAVRRAQSAGVERVFFVDADGLYSLIRDENGKVINRTPFDGVVFNNHGMDTMIINVNRDIKNAHHEISHEMLKKLNDAERSKYLKKAIGAIFKGKKSLFDRLYDYYSGLYKDAYANKSPEEFEQAVLNEMYADLVNGIDRMSWMHGVSLIQSDMPTYQRLAQKFELDNKLVEYATSEAAQTQDYSDFVKGKQYSLSQPVTMDGDNVAEDNQGASLSRGQLEYFKGSRVRDNLGRLLKLWHGSITHATQNIFDPQWAADHLSFFAVDDPRIAGSYSGTMREVNPMREMTEVPGIEEMDDNELGDFLAKRAEEETGYSDGYGRVFVENELYDNVENLYTLAHSLDTLMALAPYSKDFLNAAQRIRNLMEAAAGDADNYFEGVIEQAKIARDHLPEIAEIAPSLKRFIDKIMNQLEEELDNFEYLYDELYDAYENNESVFEFDGEMVSREDAIELAQQFAPPTVEDFTTRGNRPLYANLKNPYIYDAEGGIWSRLSDKDGIRAYLERIGNPKQQENFLFREDIPGTMTTNGVVNWAHAHGYDGVIFRNIEDVGGKDDGTLDGTLATIVVGFESNQFKDPDNKNPTNDPDFRFSISSAQDWYENATEDERKVEMASIRTFGITSNYRHGGYIIPQGQMLNFSGSHELRPQDRQTYEKFQENRTVDHREIANVYKSVGIDVGTNMQDKGMVEFMRQGNIRMQPEAPGVHLFKTTAPTTEQLATIEKYIEWAQQNRRVHGSDTFMVDIMDDNGNNAESKTFKLGQSADDITDEIAYYYEHGSFKRKYVSPFAMFFSLSVDDWKDSTRSSTVKVVDAATEIFGTTPYFCYGGYITPYGDMLDFSGIDQQMDSLLAMGEPAEEVEEMRTWMKNNPNGMRTGGATHSTVEKAYKQSGVKLLPDNNNYRSDFIERGNVRIAAEGPAIEASAGAELTDVQCEKLLDYIKWVFSHKDWPGSSQWAKDPKLTVEINGGYGTTFYDFSTSPESIVMDIKEKAASPKKNYVSNLSMFFSLSSGASEIETNGDSANKLYSLSTWNASDYVTDREKAITALVEQLGVTYEQAEKWVDDVNSVAKMIAEDKGRLDYKDTGKSPFVSNAEYGGSFDFTTLCKKRRLLTGTFSAIQNALPNTVLTPFDVLSIRAMMDDAGLEVSCGKCYVEGSRATMGIFTKEFLKLYEKYHPGEWVPNMAQMNTPDGIEWVRQNHPEVYEEYEYFWNHYGTLRKGDKNLFASQQKPKLYQMRSAYKGEIRQHFEDADMIREKNRNGGIRMQSFSDFEIVHLIDAMQVITDMSRVGLQGQAYTKVPDFAWALGDTGLKINLSIDAWSVDENGKLVFNNKEGMNFDTAMELRNAYPRNVGTICCVYDDAQLLAALADDRIDFIIPFHRSQWKKAQYKAMGLPATTKDYTYQQNEKWLNPKEHTHKWQGRDVPTKCTNYMPNEYWDFSKSGKENAEKYLGMCARDGKRPKFYKFLTDNKDGSYSLKEDGSTDGYWKLLIDFKMYDNNGNGSPQLPVRPIFNMDQVNRMLNSYDENPNVFPVAHGIVDKFVAQYKEQHPGMQYSLSKSDQQYMDAVKSDDMETAQAMVEKAAKKAGYKKEAFHGTQSFGFNEFRMISANELGVHFGTRAAAEAFYNNLYNNLGDNPGIYDVYLKMENTLRTPDVWGDPMALKNMMDDVDDWIEDGYIPRRAVNTKWTKANSKKLKEALVRNEAYDQYEADAQRWQDALYNEGEFEGAAVTDDDLDDLGRIANLSAQKYLLGLGYDSIRYINEMEDAGNESYIMLNAENIKRADAVTYDDDGNIIPLSQRFDDSNRDMRFSVAKNVVDVNGQTYDEVVYMDTDLKSRYFRNAEFNNFVMNNFAGMEIGTVSDYGVPETIVFADAKDKDVSKHGNAHHPLTELTYGRGRNRTTRMVYLNAPEVVQISKFEGYSEQDTDPRENHQWMDRNGFEYRKAYVMDRQNIYPVILSIAQADDGRSILYHAMMQKNNAVGVAFQPTSRNNPNIDFNGENQDWFARHPIASNNSIPQDGEGVNKQYSISAGMTEDERYEELKDRTITAVVDTKSQDYAEELSELEAESIAKSRAEKVIYPLAEKLGILNRALSSPEVEIEFLFSKNGGLRESLHKQLRTGGTYLDFAKALINIDDLLNSAVLIEAHTDKYAGTKRESRNLIDTKVLLSVFKDENSLVPVQFEIKNTSNDGGKLYMTVALAKIKADVTGRTEESKTPASALVSATYSIADIFKNVNPQDGHFLKYIPNQFLDDEQIAAKNEAVDEDNRRIDRYKTSEQRDMDPMYSIAVSDPDTLNFLNDQLENGDVVYTYKSFLEYEDENGDPYLIAPMAGVQKDETGKKSQSHALRPGVWEESVGNPNSKSLGKKVNDKTGEVSWTYGLEKSDVDGSVVPAAYNPYQHSSDVVLNDQFSIAYKRPNLVTYMCAIPKSELTSGYHFGVTDPEKATRSDGDIVTAKDAVGMHDWKSGSLASQLENTQRHVYLSRWLMPVRKLSNIEVAQQYKEILDREAPGLGVPFNVVPSGLLSALQEVGVPIDLTGTGLSEANYRKYLSEVNAAREEAGLEPFPYSYQTKAERDAAKKERKSAQAVRDEVDRIEKRFSLAGPAAKGADLGKLESAEQREIAGYSRDEIWKDTGWFRGVDGKWKWEIYDKDFTIRPAVLDQEWNAAIQSSLGNAENYRSEYKLPEVLRNAGMLFANYPDLKNYTVVFTEMPSNVRGEFDPSSFTITIALDDLVGYLSEAERDVRSTLMHEIQHAIQYMEGFASGSNLEAWDDQIDVNGKRVPYTPKDRAKKALEAMKLYIPADGLNRLYAMAETRNEMLHLTLQDFQKNGQLYYEKKREDYQKELLWAIGEYGLGEVADFLSNYDLSQSRNRSHKNDSDYDLYRNTAGEIEARDVQSRLEWGAERRRRNAPKYSRDAIFNTVNSWGVAGSYSLSIDPNAAYDAFGDEVEISNTNPTDLTQSELSPNLYYSDDTAYYQLDSGETVVMENVGGDSPEAQYINYLEAMNNANSTDRTTTQPYTIPPANRDVDTGYRLREQDAGLRRGTEEVPAQDQEGTSRRTGDNGELYEQSQPQSEAQEGVSKQFSVGFENPMRENATGDQTFTFRNASGQQITTLDTFPINSFEYNYLLNANQNDPFKLEDIVNEYVNRNGPQALADSFERLKGVVDYADDLTEEKKEQLHKAIDSAIKKYGKLPKGRGDKKDDVHLPKKSADNTAVRKHMQTVAANVENEHLTERMLYEGMTNELLGYTPQSNARSIRLARSILSNRFNGNFDQAMNTFSAMVESGELPRAEWIALAELLIQEFSSDPNTYDKAVKVAADLSILGTNLGQAVQAMSIIKKATPQGQLYYINGVINHLNATYAKRIENPKNKMQRITLNQELAERLMAATSRQEISDIMELIKKDIADQIPATIMDKWNAWRYLAMLGNPRTHIRNFVGNAAFMPAVFMKDLILRRLEQIPGIIDPEYKMHVPGAELTGWVGLFGKESDNTYVRFAQRDYATMQDVVAGKRTGNKFNDISDILNKRDIFGWAPLDKLSKKNGEFLEKSDFAFQKRYYVRALAEALQAQGVSEEDLLKAMEVGEENSEEPTIFNTREGREMLNKARQYATMQAQRDTYHELNTFAMALNRFKSTSGPIGNVLMEGLLPFVSTPANILVLGAAKYSLPGFIKSLVDLKAALKNGDGNTMQILDNMAAGLTGTGVMILGALLASAGLLRGGGTGDDDKDKMKKLQGHQNWAVEFTVDGKKVSYTMDWMAPMSMPLFVGATIYNLVSGQVDLSTPSNLWTALMGIADPMLAMSMLDGFENTLSSLAYSSDVNGISALLAAMTTSYFAQGMPTFFGQIARTADPDRRATYTDKNSPMPGALQRFVQNSIQSKVPGWASQKMAYVDAWGRTDTNDSWFLRALENFLSPGYANVINETPVDAELMRLYEATGDNSIIPKQLSKSFKTDEGLKDLTAEEFEQLMKVAGSAAYQICFEVMTDPVYIQADDAGKLAMMQQAFDIAKDFGRHTVSDHYALDMTKQTALKVGAADYITTKYNLPNAYSNDDLFQLLAVTPSLTTEQIADMVSAEFAPPRELSSVGNVGYVYEITDEDKAAMRDIFNEEIRAEMRKLENSQDYAEADDRERGYLINDAYNRARETTKERYSEILDNSSRAMEVGRASQAGKEKFNVAINMDGTVAEQAAYLADSYAVPSKIDNPDKKGFVINLTDAQKRDLDKEFAAAWDKEYAETLNSSAYRLAETEEDREAIVAARFNATASKVEEAFARNLSATGQVKTQFTMTADQAGEDGDFFIEDDADEYAVEALADVKAGYKWTEAYQIALDNFSTVEEQVRWMAGKMTGASSIDNPDQIGHKMVLSTDQKNTEARHEQERFIDVAIQMMNSAEFKALSFNEQAGALRDLDNAVAKLEEGKYARWLIDNSIPYEDKRDVTASRNDVFFSMLFNDKLTREEQFDLLQQRYTSKVGTSVKNNTLSYVERAHRVEAYMDYMEQNFDAFTSKYLTDDQEVAMIDRIASAFEGSLHKSGMSTSGNQTARDFGIVRKVSDEQDRANKADPNWGFNRWMSQPLDFTRDLGTSGTQTTPFVIPPNTQASSTTTPAQSSSSRATSSNGRKLDYNMHWSDYEKITNNRRK